MGNQQGVPAAITKRYHVAPTPVATAGPLGLWTVFSATAKLPHDKDHKKHGGGGGGGGAAAATGDPVSIWILKKAHASKVDASPNAPRPKEQRAQVLAHLAAAAKTLSRLRHPALLRVVELLPDTSNHVAIVTEPVFCSLANALKRYDGPGFAAGSAAAAASSSSSSSSPGGGGGGGGGTSSPTTGGGPPDALREFSLSPFEVCHGMHQVAEALRWSRTPPS